MFGLEEKRKYKALQETAATRSRGVYKRIDENRELLQLLIREAPELMQRHPYIEGWIAAQDDFFAEIARLTEVPNVVGDRTDDEYPRAWPGFRALPK